MHSIKFSGDKKMKTLLVTFILGISISADALAEGGFYMALDAGQSKFKDTCTAVPATVSCKDTDTTLRIAGGYNFAQMWGVVTPGVEVGYVDLGQAKFSGTYLGTPVSGGFKATAVIIEATGALAVSDAFSIIAKLGVVEASSKLDAAVQGFGTAGASSTRTSGGCAIGIQYDFSRKIGMRAQYENLRTFGESMTAGESNVTQISAGLVYLP